MIERSSEISKHSNEKERMTETNGDQSLRDTTEGGPCGETTTETETGTTATDRRSRLPGPAELPERYMALGLEREQREVVIYDRRNPEAWIQADCAIPRVPPGEGGPSDG